MTLYNKFFSPLIELEAENKYLINLTDFKYFCTQKNNMGKPN